MSKVFGVRFSDELALLIEQKGGAPWIKEQVQAILAELPVARGDEKDVSWESPPPSNLAKTDEDTEQMIRDRFGYTASETRTKAERDEAARRMLAKTGNESWPDEESYVRHELEQTRRQFARTSLQATESTKTLEATLERAERYARWRYRGWRSGEVASL